MSEVVLNIEGLSKSYGGHQVIKDINASATRGQVIGLVGLNGAGKTTLIETALGFALPDAGSVSILGTPSTDIGGSPVKGRIGFVPQQDELLGSYEGHEYLNLLKSFYSSWDDNLVARLASDWQVPLDRLISDLSVGQRQKLSIISALGQRPELIILDEPVASLDPVARRDFLREIVEHAADHDATVIFSTHIITDLERVAERIWLLKDGALQMNEDLGDLKDTHTAPLEELFLEIHA